MNPIIIRRSFEAAKWPKGSAEREALNRDWRTSEYMPSQRYGVVFPNGNYGIYRTKTDAEIHAKEGDR